MAQTPSASCWRWCFSENEKGREGLIEVQVEANL